VPHDNNGPLLGSFDIKYQKKPTLEILPKGEHLAEEILATFAYVYQQRKKEKRDMSVLQTSISLPQSTIVA
jgi:hypothetical protein